MAATGRCRGPATWRSRKRTRSCRWAATRRSRRPSRPGRLASSRRSGRSKRVRSQSIPTNRIAASGARTRRCAGRITSAMNDRQRSLFDDPDAAQPHPPREVPVVPTADEAARTFAVDPGNHVVLEASAGTGKTSVLVERYINLLKAGVEPANILAMTFTRKASAEMRERIVRSLRDAAARSEFDRARWSELRDRLGDIAISTIDAFCLSLLQIGRAH